jgi:hypothetical protein
MDATDDNIFKKYNDILNSSSNNIKNQFMILLEDETDENVQRLFDHYYNISTKKNDFKHLSLLIGVLSEQNLLNKICKTKTQTITTEGKKFYKYSTEYKGNTLEMYRNIYVYDHDNKHVGEIDFVIKYGNYFIIVEIKTKYNDNFLTQIPYCINLLNSKYFSFSSENGVNKIVLNSTDVGNHVSAYYKLYNFDNCYVPIFSNWKDEEYKKKVASEIFPLMKICHINLINNITISENSEKNKLSALAPTLSSTLTESAESPKGSILDRLDITKKSTWLEPAESTKSIFDRLEVGGKNITEPAKSKSILDKLGEKLSILGKRKRDGRSKKEARNILNGTKHKSLRKLHSKQKRKSSRRHSLKRKSFKYIKMSSMSRKYCLTTSPRKMGFSQKASCKAQGLLKRTSKKYKGKYVISPKSRKSKRRSKRKSKSRK